MQKINTQITLGFSCQPSFTNSWTNAAFNRSPFDFNIVSKSALLNALKTNGSNFDLQPDDFYHFKSFRSGTDGVAANGMFFWHDFERNTNFITSWRDDVPKIIERYRRRWQRFVDICKDEASQKTFLIANTQHDLHEFCGDEFGRTFGIDEEFVNNIIEELRMFGVRNFTLDLTVREISEFVSIQPAIRDHADLCRARFCGPMSIPPHASIVAETSFDFLGLGNSIGDVSELCGDYTCGMTIEKLASRSAIVSNCDGPLGEARPFPNGYIFCFANGLDNFLRATFKQGKIIFENRQIWDQI